MSYLIRSITKCTTLRTPYYALTLPLKQRYYNRRGGSRTQKPASDDEFGQLQAANTSTYVRINKLLAELGLCSRRGAEKLVLENRVRVNGHLVTELHQKFTRADKITVDGYEEKRAPRQIYIFHKPRNVLSTLDDPKGRPCISDFTIKLPGRIFNVGRLDFDVSGLLMLTNDGDFGQKLLHPKYEVEREYIARVQGRVDPIRLEKMREGIRTEDGEMLKPLRVEVVNNNDEYIGLLEHDGRHGRETYLRVTVAQGSNHFVKRLLAGAGYQCRSLARFRFGPYELKNLGIGRLRAVQDLLPDDDEIVKEETTVPVENETVENEEGIEEEESNSTKKEE